MEPQQPHNHARNPQLPHLQSVLPPHIPSRTANSTPISSPGLFSPGNPRSNMSLPPQTVSEGTTPAPTHSPYLHPLQTHRVRETHIANVDRDFTTGRKIINHYEIIDEIGRGVHGKVKLARNLENGENVAIKIIPRFSKKRRLGKVTANMNPQEKTKREIAILKKIRHPNVVALLEVIDDPELKKIYMVLEHVERGEIVWRKKGLPHICAYERRRAEREMRGESLTAQEEDYGRILERRHTIKEMKRAKTTQVQPGHHDYWSLEYAAEDDDVDMQSRISSLSNIEYAERAVPSNPPSMQGSRPSSRAPSRTHSVRSLHRTNNASYSTEPDLTPLPLDEGDLDTPGPLRSNPGSTTALDGTMYGAYDDAGFRGRSPSMADSIISHMSSIDLGTQVNDSFAEDFSFVPCFTMEHARATFRDTVLGLEYLHYEGVVHRDIKPANLLWTRDHRVKISDFGVSYFGRPIRDGEVDDTVSESEARDFDDDLELAKTVGTPAFFAPELCYTDLDSEQPRVSEQIDVWSLGVTLYCLIFARIPFLAEDEFQMFRKIAKEEVYIPSRRLKPVDPSTSPKTTSLYNRINSAPYRDDDELGYEEVDDVLRDLLKRMLIKNPEKRIRLREVKRHPWVVQGISNVVGWLDDTDPSRRTAGRKIQVDDKEMREAVIPLSLLERARSAVKKTFNKFTHPRTDRGESTSRRRATSSAASSAGDSPATNPSTPYPRDIRRRSLRGDSDYFATVREYIQPSGEHPLSQSVAASPQDSPLDQGPSSTTASVGGFSDMMAKEEAAERQTATANQKLAKHHYARSITNAFLSLAPHAHEAHSHTVPATPAFDGPADDSSFLRKSRDVNSSPEDASRARSADRAIIFSSVDKRAGAKVSLSTAVAPGNVALPKRAQQIRPGENPLPSPSFFSMGTINAYQHGQPKSDPNMHDKQRTIVELDERPMTAQRIEDVPDGKTPAPRVYNTSTPESFARAQETNRRRQLHEYEDQLRRQYASKVSIEALDPALIPCPPSPDDELFLQQHSAPSREETATTTAVSSSSVSVDAYTTPLTSPSVVTSPLYVANPIPMKDISEQISEQILAFQSDPSLPALLSGASSVSADLEGEFLGHPGNPDAVKNTALLETTDSLTPPAMTKEPIAGFPLEQQELSQEGNVIPVYIDRHTVKYTASASPSASARAIEDDEDSDSDEGLVMIKSKKKSAAAAKDAQAAMGKMVIGSKRRDTNASVGSTETAKKVVVHSD